ncbi:hypothetical protein GSI_05470 [Ganoderma sinense ZZ0214-1]|uniref:Uncharacterized protein n=1 Tax=Ganoderma sinense ZZ0214-1 TaxID=1077348 RepID=A0A2G8SEM5_9APHY|nr:hypothetical protein GSI_05470 [Ganoderma sinense ZZ0214-1]
MRACEVRVEPECGDGAVENRTVEFAKDVGAAAVARKHDVGTKIAWAHLAVEGFLDGRVAHEDKGATLEIEVCNRRAVLAFQSASGLVASVIDLGVDAREVVLPSGERTGSSTNEIRGRKECVGSRHEERRLNNVEREDGVTASDREVRGAPELTANGDTTGPEDVVEEVSPA